MSEVSLSRLWRAHERPTILAGFRWGDALVGFALVLVFLLKHPFEGIDHDSRIYMGRALADLDPAGIGRDLMFRLDGQSTFSVFRVLAREAVGLMGLGKAVLVLSVVNLVVWSAAITVFARILLPGRAIVLGFAAVGVLSTVYVPWHLIAAGETFPVPRALAEGCVLLALAAICRDRLLGALALLVLAAAFHPIMAVPGFGVLFVVLCLNDRRWLVAGLVAAVAVVSAAALGLPVAARLMVRVDPAWSSILVDRNPYLYVGRWPLGPLSAMFMVRAATIGIACSFLTGRARVVLLAALGIAIAGVGVSFVLGDLAGSLLILQAQLWRALWLPAALAPLAAGVCLWRLPERGPAGQIALAFLVASWVCLDGVEMALLAAALALAAHVGAPRLSIRLDRVAIVVWLVVSALVAFEAWIAFSGLVEIIRSLPDGRTFPSMFIDPMHVAMLPVMLLAFAWWRWRDHPWTAPFSVAVVAGLTLLVSTYWDSRDAAKAETDSGARKPDLAAILATRPGSVLWLEGDDAWYWVGRPIWNGQIHGSAIVFSRELALEWERRAKAVVAAGLATPYLLRPLEVPAPVPAQTLDGEKIAAFCGAFDGRDADQPAWIVSPLDPDTKIPAGLGAQTWSAPAPHFTHLVSDGALHWRRLQRYVVIPCAPGSPRAEPRPAASPSCVTKGDGRGCAASRP